MIIVLFLCQEGKEGYFYQAFWRICLSTSTLYTCSQWHWHWCWFL